MKRSISRKRGRGFTLIELTMAMSLGMIVAAMVLALANQQLAFLRIFGAQNFLTEEAPMINTHVSKLIGKSERFRLHDSRADALADSLAGSNPRLIDSPVLVMNFRQPDNTMRASILAFEDLGDGPALYYYVVPDSGVLGPPQWAVTRQPQDVSFSVEQGILRMTIVGVNGEQIIYSGSMQQ